MRVFFIMYTSGYFNFSITSYTSGIPSHVDYQKYHESTLFKTIYPIGDFYVFSPITVGNKESNIADLYSPVKTCLLSPDTATILSFTDAGGNNVSVTDNIAKLTSQTYSIVFSYKKNYTVGVVSWNVEGTITYIFSATYNRLPLKKWTIPDVIDRIFDTIEPLRDSGNTTDTPKFYLRESDREKLKNVLSPEFTFTKMTLREMLKEIGGYIHAEPRITSIDSMTGTSEMRFEVGFDYYGGNEVSKISKRRHVSATIGTDVNEHCTGLDSTVDNLISQLNWAQGAITEPFINQSYYGRSLRSEITTVRLGEDEKTVIPTTKPIYQLGGDLRVTCVLINPQDNSGALTGRWDITPYIFEKTAYDNLSSYGGTYPYSKAYALYYEIGQPNIKGLFFKNPNAISPVFEKYAIINILEAVTGQTLNVGGRLLYDMQFQIEYLPIFSARIKANKAYYEGGIKRELAYNQTANMIEAQHYGENLKGVVARLGNVEKTYTYHLAFLSQVPKVGTKFDEHYYISAVYTQLLPTYIKCTVALSKDFNRLSQYVGINSIKRMWEVSERQTQRRDSVYTEYLLITENANEISNGNSLFQLSDKIAKVLFDSEDETIKTTISAPVSSFYCHRYIKGRKEIGSCISLPVVACAFGNSMSFSAQFYDNYSAGNCDVHYTSEETLSGESAVYSQPVPYNDHYGRFYYLKFGMECGNNIKAETTDYSTEGQVVTMRAYPGVETFSATAVAITGNHFIRYRKDNREIPSITYELAAITDDEDTIIGSELMRNCKLVNAYPSTELQLRLYRTPIPTIGDEIYNITHAVGSFTINDTSITLDCGAGNDPSQYVAWALCTVRNSESIDVEDESGNETTQTIYKGGKLLIGQNKPLGTGKTLYFRIKRRLYY